jgi:hypothetical protein
MIVLNVTNNWEHLVMSIITMAVGVYLYMRGVNGLGLGLVALVTTTWFVPAAAKQVAGQIADEVQNRVTQASMMTTMQWPAITRKQASQQPPESPGGTDAKGS